MSQFSQALHNVGLLGNPGQQHDAGLLGTLQTILGIPAAAIHGQLEQWRAVGPAWQAYHQRQQDITNWQAQDPRTRGPAPPASGGVTIQGVGEDTSAPNSTAFTPPPTPPPSQGVRAPGFRDMAPWLQQGALLGAPGVATAAQIGQAAQPNMQVDATSGQTYDQGDPSSVPPRFERRSTINGWNVDPYTQGNTGQFFPNAPVNGAVPVTGPNGMSWALPSGTTEAVQGTAQANQTGQTMGTSMDVPDGHGGTSRMLGSQFYGQGGAGGGQPGASGQGSGLGHQPGPGDLGYDTHTAENAATRYNTYIDAGRTAGAQISNLQGLGSLLQGFDGNPASSTFLRLTEVAKSLGVTLSPNTSREEAARSIAQGMALALHSQLPGPMSNADRAYLDSMVPGLAMTDAGRQRLIDAQTRMAERQQFIASAAQRWNDHYGRIDHADSSGRHFEDYVGLYNQQNPIFPRQRTARPPGVH